MANPENDNLLSIESDALASAVPILPSDGPATLEEIVANPGAFDGLPIRIQGTYASLAYIDAYFKLEQSGHVIWVFCGQLPIEQKGMILRKDEARGRAVVVDGVLEGRSGIPQLKASNVCIEGMWPKPSSLSPDCSIELMQVLDGGNQPNDAKKMAETGDTWSRWQHGAIVGALYGSITLGMGELIDTGSLFLGISMGIVGTFCGATGGACISSRRGWISILVLSSLMGLLSLQSSLDTDRTFGRFLQMLFFGAFVGWAIGIPIRAIIWIAGLVSRSRQNGWVKL